jgi:hypothetical protein
MKYWLSAAVAAGLVLAPVAGHAAKTKKVHRAQMQRSAMAPNPPRAVRGDASDPSGGNAAAGGNNAASMSGSNSAGDNVNGRTSGSGYGGN